jgi:MaoC like domain
MTETAVRHKRGGLYFEDFHIGDVIEHRYTRTVTQMDNMLFSNMTLNPQPLHIDRHLRDRNGVGPTAHELAVYARIDDRHVGLRSQRWNHDCQSRNDGGQVPCSAVRRRYRARYDGNPREARVEVASRRRHRRIPSPRLQSARHACGRMPPSGLHAHAAEMTGAR